MRQCQKDILVFHRYGDRSHFLAIDKRVAGYITCDPLIVFSRVAKGKCNLAIMLKDLSEIFKGWLRRPPVKVYVYGFAPESAYFVILCLAWWRPGRRVLFSSFSDTVEGLGKLRRLILRSNLRFAGAFFDAAAAVSLSSEAIFAPYLPTELVEHAIDVDRYKRYNIRVGLIFLGRIAPYKNVGMVMNSSARKGFVLDLVGPMESNLELLNNMSEGVRYLGTQTKDWIQENLGRYRALVLASDPREPFGIVLLEAMAAGTLVVASRTHGSRTIFRDWPDYPLIFDAESPNGLDEALARLATLSQNEEDSLRERLIIMARNYRPEERAHKWGSVLA